MVVHVCPLIDLSAYMYRKCVNLNFRDQGLMQSTLRSLRKNKTPDVYVLYIMDGDKLASWALVQKQRKIALRMYSIQRYRAYEVPCVLKDNVLNCMFYTRVKLRNKGYGACIMQEIHNLCTEIGCSTVRVHPHDTTSRKFFNACLKANTTTNSIME